MLARARTRAEPRSAPLATTILIAAFVLAHVSAEILTPPYFNLATGKKITATATCGEEGPELFCKLVGANAERDDIGHVIQGQVCDYCDMNNASKRHPPEYAADGMETWWQSPPLSRGMKYNEVNLTIDLGQEFHVAYVFVRMGNSPRPGLWALEKSTDYGKTFKPWQYFSDSPQDCEINFGKESLLPITKDDSVICSTEYSQIVPLEGGEIPIPLLKYRPSAKMYFNSSVLQEWTRATTVRLRLLQTKNLLGHLMSVHRQDPTVTRRYFYSIKDISIGGRCMCNGHAESCEPGEENRLNCRCQHHTCGPQCAACCVGFEQKKWRISQNWNQFACEPCNCHSHTTECVYDADVDAKRLSLDIHGNYEGGGVCQNCQHNTEGINCNKCKATFYRPHGKFWNETDVCQPCNCNYHYSTGSCAEGTGQCECRPEFNPPRCDSCRFGYYDYPDCKPCPCNINGTQGDFCTPRQEMCPCKPNYFGQFCMECADGYYSNECKACECNPVGSLSETCDKSTGDCTCKSKFSGRTCDHCEAGFYDYPTCSYCNCDSSGTEPSICDEVTGRCICKEGFGGARCDQCIPGYYMELRGRERACVPCACSSRGSSSASCAATGKCSCLSNFGGRQCDQCSPGHYQYPDCLPCNCDQYGAIGVSCDDSGQCQCKKNFDKLQCDTCNAHFYNYPACEECNCDPNGVIASFAGCGSVPAGELCQCKDRVQGRICNDCKPLFWNLQDYNPHGCEGCECNLAGTQGGIGVCDTRSGQCSCKLAVGERACTQCQDGFYNLTANNFFGCTDCDCDIGGSVDDNCDKSSGQCKCHARIEGRRCDEPITAHYFPTLHQFQLEVENGRTPSNGHVRYDFSEEVFPGYSWRGYAVFSPPLLTEVINDVTIYKSSMYRMVIRYVNPTKDNVVASIVITPENPSDVVQRFLVLLKPTTAPQFVTVSGDKGVTPSHFVMNHGKWEVALKTNKNVYIDYLVLIPQAYYEATVLIKQVEKPCVVGERKLCRHFAYPSLAAFAAVPGSAALGQVREYIDNPQQLDELGVAATDVPLLSGTQEELRYEAAVGGRGPHVLLLEYVTPAGRAAPAGGPVSVKVSPSGATDSERDHFSVITLNDCPYTSPCRQVLLDEMSKVLVVDVQDSFYNIIIQGEVGTLAGIKTIVAIPASEWHLDYITPRPFCVRKDGACTPAIFTGTVNTKKVEFEAAARGEQLAARPYILDNSTQVVYLQPDDSLLHVQAKVPAAESYMFVVHYYQPDHPESTINVVVTADGQSRDAILPITHCPSNSGCRSVVQQADGNTRFPITDTFDLSFKAKSGKGVWLDYFLIVVSDDYKDTLIKEANALDYTREFITTCARNHYHVDITDEGFCRDSIFSITSDYNSGALQCFCDSLGSTSYTCNKFGGQCDCRPNVIGRTCKECRPGYYGFPNCRPCDCPSKMCAEDGSCICPVNVEGERCERCMPETYGFDIVVGCTDCNCHPLGVVDNQLQCDSFNGSCQCKENVVGRTCDRCEAGHWSFPYCSECQCSLAGTTADVCDQDTAHCSCKPNVGGQACDTCLDGHFDLQAENPDGCTKCFCFGKTTRCTSSYLQWAQITGMDGWHLANVGRNGSDMIVLLHSNPPQLLNSSVIGAELAVEEALDQIVYFGAPQYYLGQRLNSYGGYLNYTIFYTTGPFGKAIPSGDVILEGPSGFLIHNSFEQPPATTHWQHSLHIIESEFVTADGGPVSRDLLMTTLKNLKAVYIRATYWAISVTARLERVSMDVAVDMEWGESSVAAASVEQCQCPAAYKGLSCELCADGHYRLDSGPHGGFCVPCQCHGHSDTCDVDTGVCLNCRDSTTGDHCEQCIPGYHGNATLGSPNDCLICACPLPIVSNNFAYSCRVNDSGELIACECPEGYIGPRCEACAAGYYGNPENPGDYCKPCNCSGNIAAEDPGSCDSITGDCLKCVHNTAGEACHICAPGFYGDAVYQKNCQACICDENGMEYCDNNNGQCVCRAGVEGEKCDRCRAEHWGLASGAGCQPCACGLAAESRQCDEDAGQCRCAKGVTGQKCDSCAAGYWNYTQDGCDHCNCNTGYSVGFGCNALTGHCECLPGAIGSKCEQCPHRWVLIPKVGCESCDSCTGDLLDSVEELNRTLAPVALEFKNKANSYFTTQRLHYINETASALRPLVQALDPSRVDLLNVTAAVDELHSKAKNLHRRSQYAKNDSETNGELSGELLGAAEAVLEEARRGAAAAAGAVDHVAALAVSLELGDQPKIDSALAEGVQIKSDISAKNLSTKLEKSGEMLQNARNLQERMIVFISPVSEQSKTFKELRNKVDNFDGILKDIQNWSEDVTKTLNRAISLNDRNNASKFQPTLNSVNQQNIEAYEDIVLAARLMVNASGAQQVAGAVLPNVTSQHASAARLCEDVRRRLGDFRAERPALDELTASADRHAQSLRNKTETLNRLLNRLKNNSKTEDAYKAASSHTEIVDNIQEAKRAADAVDLAVANITLMEARLSEDSAPALERSWGLERRGTEGVEAAAVLTPRVRATADAVAQLRALNHTTNQHLNEIESYLDDKLPSALSDLELSDLKLTAMRVASSVRDRIEGMADLRELPASRLRAQNLYKDTADAVKNITTISNQIESINGRNSTITDLLHQVDVRRNNFGDKLNDFEKHLSHLNEQIKLAKDLASRIKVGMWFDEKATLQPELPPSVEEMGTATHVSAYFRTSEEDGFLLYLGNPEGSKLRRTRSDDFMALEISNGYPYLIIDIGDAGDSGREPARINSKKKVSDNKWYQVIVDRVGKNVKLTIREPLDNGSDVSHTTERVLPGQHTIFNLDKDHSRLYVGGYPSGARVQSQVAFSSFNGQIEEVVIGDTPVGLWNFREADNLQGARERDRLRSAETSNGYRFNGEGYAGVDARSYVTTAEGIEVSLRFRTYAPDGLLFLLGERSSFLSLEMREGALYLQFRLGGGEMVTIGTAQPGELNDGKWHTAQVNRYLNKGTLQVDGRPLETGETAGDTRLLPTERMYFGGFPKGHGFLEITDRGFDGCIEDVYVTGTPVDLTQNDDATGVTAGCRFASLVSLDGDASFLRYQNSSSADAFQLSLKFKSAAEDGLIFYSTNRDQSSGISLALHQGKLVLRSQGELLDTGSNTYGDDRWHVVTATHGSRALTLSVDDYDYFSTDTAPSPLHIVSGELFLGGAPANYMIVPQATATRAPLAGCIGDVTLNGQVVNVAGAVSLRGATIGRCGAVTSTSGILSPDTNQPTVIRGNYEDSNSGRIDQPPPLPEVPTTMLPTTPEWRPTEPLTTLPPSTAAPSTKRPPPVVESGCALGFDPSFEESSPATGYRFGTRNDSRIEFGRLPGRQSSGYDLAVDFSASGGSAGAGGLLFYAADPTQREFVALFMKDGKLYFYYNCGTEDDNIIAPADYRDGAWHRATISLEDGRAKLSVDEALVGETISRCSAGRAILQPPFYLGGLPHYGDTTQAALGGWEYTPFEGCLKDLKMNNSPFNDIRVKTNVLPCRQSTEEQGVFFRPPGGYLKLMKRFKVGTDMSISLEIKARNSSGLLVSVHGKKDFLILEIVDNEVILRVDNGKGPFQAIYNLGSKYHMCDGRWHTIYAIKSRHVVSLVVDGHFSDAGVGQSPSTDTSSALFIGGHPKLQHSLRGARSRRGFAGCLRNVIVNDAPVPIPVHALYGSVSYGMCPTD